MKNTRPSLFKRGLALLLDFLLLSLVGLVLGLFLERQFVAAGKYGTLIGSTLTVLYFGILQSRIGKGQSVGKRAIGAKVLGLDGNYLSVEKSMLRAFVLFFPVMNAGLFSVNRSTVYFLALIIGLVLTTLYLAIVNKSGRGLHDAVAQSIVVKEFATVPETNLQSDFAFPKFVSALVLGAVLVAGSVYVLTTKNTLADLLVLAEKIEDKEEVVRVSGIKLTDNAFFSSEAPAQRYRALNLAVHVADEALVTSRSLAFLDELYAVVQTMPEVGKTDQVGITLIYGYNIGIGSKTNAVTKTFSR